jgi:fumarylacetoacetate (FAA) hydrolase family protein
LQAVKRRRDLRGQHAGASDRGAGAGDLTKAQDIRVALTAIIGDNLAQLKPGSDDAVRVKAELIKRGAWSQYLEVGIGPDAEIFTKAPVLSAVGLGADIGIHPKSVWNNPEPEVVLAVNSRGEVVGAALGNDVNLRDFEAAVHSCLARRRTTTPPAPSVRSSGCAMSISGSTTSGRPSLRCALKAPVTAL